jgi:insulysin
VGGTSPRPDLLEFWKTHYQTYNLRLCVVGRAGLDNLQQTVEETFGQLPPSNGQPRHRNENGDSSSGIFLREHAQYEGVAAFGPGELGRLIETIPFLESRTIKLSFATPPLDDPMLKGSRPYRVVSHLLGHEAPGSLHALLNDMGYLMDLSSGIGVDTSDFSLFTLTMSLTPKGMRERDTVLDLVFQWIAMIRKTALEDVSKMQLYHNELRNISEMNFRFRENGDPTDFCSSAAELMFNTEPSHILVGSSRTGDYDPAVAQQFFNRLRPENCLITVVNSDLDSSAADWKQEPWYGAKYRVLELSAEQMKEWESPERFDPSLHLPALNDYIPTDFSLRCDDHGHEEVSEDAELEPPSLLIDRQDLRLWHKMDRYWRVPKTFIRLSIQSPDIYRSPRTMTLNRIYQRVLNDDLNSFVYDASVAGCTYR